MRNIPVAILVAVLPISAASAEPFGVQKPDKPAASDRLLPVKRSGAINSCAAYGAGFIKVEGTETCVKIGGAVEHRGRRHHRRALTATERADMQLDIIVPVIMSCALLWWIGRGMNSTTRLVVAAITLVVVVCIVLFERSMG